MQKLRPIVSVLVAAALVAGCASPRTKAQHRAALDACVSSPDPSRSVDCERADILREQMEYERSENASLAVGAFALSILTLGIIAAFDDNDCCYYKNRGYYGRYGYRHSGAYRGGPRDGHRDGWDGRADGGQLAVEDNAAPRGRGDGARSARR